MARQSFEVEDAYTKQRLVKLHDFGLEGLRSTLLGQG